jgi:hypothetical protein
MPGLRVLDEDTADWMTVLRIRIRIHQFLGLPDLYDFLSLKYDVNVPSKSNTQKNFEKT